MKVTQYGSAKKFLDRAQAYLEQDEALNGLILGISFRLAERPSRRRNRPYLAVVENAGEIMAAAIMTPPRSLVVYSHQSGSRAAMAALAGDLQAGGWSIPGVRGPSAVARAFADAWHDTTGTAVREGMRQRAFELRKVLPVTMSPGHMRPANADDFATVVRWKLAFMEEALAEAGDEEAASLLARQQIQDGFIFVWQDGPDVVSMSAKARPTRHGITVNQVYTPPAQRGRGYATSLVATLSQQLLDDGWQFCTLFTDQANPVSNHIYEKIGYTAVADFHEYCF